MLAIPTWTREDYTSSEAPYDWLYRHKDNQFLLKQLVEQVRVQAGACGVKNFLSLWKSYLELQNSRVPRAANNVTSFEGQPIELVCGDYDCSGDSITTVDRFGFEVEVLPHPLLIVRRLKNIDDGMEKLELWYRRPGIVRTLIVDKATLASANKILDLAAHGLAVNSENAKSVVRYLSTLEALNYEQIPETSSVGRCGWINGHGFSPYCDGVKFDGEISYKHIFDSIRPHGDYDEWKKIARTVRAGNVVPRIALAASFASALVEPLGCLPFFVHLWGRSEGGKSVSLVTAASVWAAPGIGDYVRTFNSTAVGQEITAGFLNSLPLCLDELQIVKDRRDFDRDIYSLTEGVGRSRGAKTGGLQRLTTWHNCILTTGEQPITNPRSGGGAVNRVIEIDCTDQQLFDDPRLVASTVKLNYGHAGRDFVQRIPDCIEDIKTIYEVMYNKLATTTQATDKQRASAALLLTADCFATSWIFDDGRQLAVDDIAPFLAGRDEIDLCAHALDWLRDFIATNPRRFTAHDNSGELWGEIDDDCTYIIKSVFDSKMLDAGFNPTAFLSWAKRKGCVRHSAKRATVQHRFSGLTSQPVWCVCLLNDTAV